MASSRSLRRCSTLAISRPFGSAATDRVIGFLGIGAQKCGTSWLHHMLSTHPGISFPAGKEVHYWDELSHLGVEHYASWLDAGDGKLHGDITPAYAVMDIQKIRGCHSSFPWLRMIYIIRNPIERAWSAACMDLAREGGCLAEVPDGRFADHVRSQGSLARGDYEMCLRNWREVFGHEQVLVLRFEDISAQPARMLNECCAHIGVEPSYGEGDPLLSKRVNPGRGVPLRPSLMPLLASLYAARIRSLEQYLQTDLAAWIPA
jgi:hypothetical protein